MSLTRFSALAALTGPFWLSAPCVATATNGRDVPFFVGTWAEKHEWCGVTASSGRVDERQVSFSTDAIELYLTHCAVAGIEATTSSYRVQGQCTEEGDGEGERRHDWFEFESDGDALLVRSAEGDTWRFVRCP